MKQRAFTVIELLVVIGIIAVLLSLLFPAMIAQRENARIDEMKSQLGIFEAALAQYQREFGDYPPSSGSGDNAGAESMLACLRTTQGGSRFISEQKIAGWLGDTDGDGRQELLDPWKNPWIYFHPSEYAQGAVYYMIGGRRSEATPLKKGEVFHNLTSYQLWACGPNKTNQSGQDDDVGNVLR